MTVRSAPYFWVTCDKCGRREPPEDSEWTAWESRDQALDCASDSEWMLVYTPGGNKLMAIFCPECWARAQAEEEA